MDQIRIVKDEDKVFLSQEDLLKVLNERLQQFPKEYEELKKPQQSKVVNANGIPTFLPPNEKAIAKHEGMETMLKGIINILSP